MMHGYMGTILHVDLSAGNIRRTELDPDLARAYVGGNGFAAKLIADAIPPQVDPLSEDNVVVFALGPFNGSTFWGAGRGHVAAISPQTGYFADSNFGGNFAAMLKQTGVDAVAISGKAATPVYLAICDDDVAIKDARDLWGTSTEEAHARLTAKEGKGIESAVIGPAGENGVLFANIMCSGARISAAGRAGIGAVLGAKNCKAIVARGTRKVMAADQERLTAFQKASLATLREKARALTDLGTPVLVNMINAQGKLCTHNNTRETFEHAHDISGEVIAEHYKIKNVSCHRCPVACGKLVRVPTGAFAEQAVKMPEYETIYAFGSMLDNRDIVSIFNSNAMCDLLGLDTITMGVTLAFLAECQEQQIVSPAELGATIAFGDGAHLAELVELTARKQGVGELLALGSERIAAHLGRDAHKLLYSVQGLEIAGHSARGIRTMGLAYATSTRGGSHHDARPNYQEPEDDPGLAAHAAYCVSSQNYTALTDSLVLCRFVAERVFGTRVNETVQDVLGFITGEERTLEEVEAIGARIYTLERLINTRRGLNRARDTLPYRVLHEPIADGPVKGRYCPEDALQSMLDTYYDLRGWDGDGVPTAATLAELHITT